MNDKFSREEDLETDKFVGVDQPFVYDVEDLMTTVAITGPNYYTTVTGAVEVAMQKCPSFRFSDGGGATIRMPRRCGIAEVA